jgi:hypothetical protein
VLARVSQSRVARLLGERDVAHQLFRTGLLARIV